MKKYNKKQRGGYVNQSFGIPNDVAKKNDKRMGNYWSSIDFQMHEQKQTEYPTGPSKIGYLQVGNHDIELTMADCNRIAHTLVEAIDLAKKKYKLNM